MHCFPSIAVVRRELLVNMRRKRNFVFLALLVAIAAFVVMSNWPRGGFNMYQQQSFANFTRISTEMVLFFMFTLVGAVGLFVPALASSAFVAEKERDTYDLLILTLIRPSGLIIAKMLNTGGLLLLMLIATLPILGSTFFLIGLDLAQVIQPFLVIVAATISCAMISICCSAFFRRSIPATIAAYLAIVFFMGGWLLPLVAVWELFGWSGWSGGSGLIMVMLCFVSCPFYTCIVPIMGAPFSAINAGTLCYLAYCYHALLALIAFRLTLRALRRPQKPPKTLNEKPIDDEAALTERRKKFPYYLIDPLRRKPPIEDGRNPMLVKELRWGMAQRTTATIRTFYGALFLSMLFTVPIVYATVDEGWGYSESYLLHEALVVLFTIETVLIALAAPIFLSSAFTKEYELGNIDMLRMTLIRPINIVLGKIMAGLFALAPLIAAALLSALLVAVACGPSGKTFLSLFCGTITVLVNVAVAISISLFASVITRRSSTALITSYVLGLAVCLGLPLSVVLTAELYGAGVSRDIEQSISALSPIVSFWCFVEYPRDGATQLALWMASMSTYALASVMLTGFAAFRFTRRQA